MDVCRLLLLLPYGCGFGDWLGGRELIGIRARHIARARRWISRGRECETTESEEKRGAGGGIDRECRRTKKMGQRAMADREDGFGTYFK